MIEQLKNLGYTVKVHSFGIDVFKGSKIVFHGRKEEIIKWLEERK